MRESRLPAISTGGPGRFAGFVEAESGFGGRAPPRVYTSRMKNISHLLRQFTDLIRGQPSARQGRTVVLVGRGQVEDQPEAAHIIGLGLHDACTRRGVSSALVDVDEWVTRAALGEGRFDADAWPEPGLIDPFTGEPARERALKEDVTWLMRHRDRLLRAALTGGGDAEVLIVLHELPLFDVFVRVDIRRLRKMVDIVVFPTGGGHPGFTAVGQPRDLPEPLRYGVNAADDARSWDMLLESILRPRK